MCARVAVVNDDSSFIEVMVELLEEEGYDTLSYYQGEGTFLGLCQDRPDLILLDLRMEQPGSGWQLAHLLRRDPRTASIPLIMTSADTMQLQDRAAWLKEEGIATLEKPFDLEDVLQRVAAALAPRTPLHTEADSRFVDPAVLSRS